MDSRPQRRSSPRWPGLPSAGVGAGWGCDARGRRVRGLVGTFRGGASLSGTVGGLDHGARWDARVPSAREAAGRGPRKGILLWALTGDDLPALRGDAKDDAPRGATSTRERRL